MSHVVVCKSRLYFSYTQVYNDTYTREIPKIGYVFCHMIDVMSVLFDKYVLRFEKNNIFKYQYYFNHQKRSEFCGTYKQTSPFTLDLLFEKIPSDLKYKLDRA